MQMTKCKQKENIYLTELQAWKVAEVLFSRRDGFCRMIRMLKANCLITDRVSKQMSKRFEHLPNYDPDTPDYKFPKTCGGDYDLHSVIFAENKADMLSYRLKRNK